MKEKKKKVKSITVKANKKGRHIMKLMNFLRVLVIPLYYLVKPFRFYGNRKVADGACLYVCNHYTLMDAVYPACTTWEGIHYIGKQEIADAFLIGPIAKGVKMISVNRDGKDVRGLLECFKCLKNNEKLAIFPEGTRNKSDAELLPFHHGAAAIAIRSKVKIVPMVIYKKPRFFRRTHILIGYPFELTEYYDKKLTEAEFAEADEKLRERMLAMRAEHTKFLEAKKQAKKGKKA